MTASAGGSAPGCPAPLAARRTAEAGWAGLHKFVGVPGTVGGGVYMNAGCHGGEWAEVVDAGDRGGRHGQERVAHAGRRSRSPTAGAGWTAWSCSRPRSSCARSEPERLAEEVAELFRWRQEGTPFNQPCCGSVFKNPGGPELAAPRGARGRPGS